MMSPFPSHPAIDSHLMQSTKIKRPTARHFSRGAARALAIFAFFCAGQAAAAPAPVNEIEALTWTELRARIAGGATTVLVPIGGTEQNGPYMVIGKHNVRARVLAGAIAEKLGNALVAPVVSYVPEGAVHPPAAHMRFAGTITIPDTVFEALLASTARSFRQHGFRDVVFLGDHGGYQKSEQKVAASLNREWASDPSCRVHALVSYYEASQGPFVAALKKRGFSDADIGTHAGLADTALALAVDPALVRSGELARAPKPGPADGVHGDPRRATRELGEIGIEQIIRTAVQDIQALARQPR
jgi:creatinine amidohydrolase